MILKIKQKIKHYKKGTVSIREIAVLKCDQCHTVFERYVKNISKTHFCNKKCKYEASKLDNILDKNRRNTCLQRVGVESYTKLECTKEKQKRTNLKKYGVPASSMAKSVKKKQEDTNLKKYGYKSSAMHSETIKKFHKTCLKRYGTKTPTESKQIQAKSIKTCKKNYKVDYPQQSKINREKSLKTCQQKYGVNHVINLDTVKFAIKQTLLKNYGVENPMHSEIIKKKQQNTIIRKYGVTNISKLPEVKLKLDYSEIRRKAHETMKKQKTYGKSKIEDTFYQCLVKLFGIDDIQRQVYIHKWSIDFLIRTTKTYIQFDGIYWHGLNRPTKEIREFKKPRDKVIYHTYLRDQNQNKWFKQSNIKLIRIKDKEFRKAKFKDKFIKQKLGIIF